ncbi:hypothetical protein ACA910_011080 [Epithemia clementina (nom. ined.)]
MSSPPRPPSNSVNSSDDCLSPIVTMIRCQNCGRLVPEPNMELHMIRSCEATKPPARPHQHSFNNNQNHNHNNVDSDIASQSAEQSSNNEQISRSQRDREGNSWTGGNSHPESILSSPRCVSSDVEVQPSVPVAAAAMRTSVDASSDDDEEEEGEEDQRHHENGSTIYIDDEPPAPPNVKRNQNKKQIEVIDLMEVDEDSSQGDEVEEQWTCRRCTLLNPMTALRCDACQSQNPHQTRQADPVRRERLLYGPDESFGYSQLLSDHGSVSRSPGTNSFGSPSSSASYLSGGALVGGLLGAATSYARGRPMASGALSGAMQGALGGVLFNEMFGERNQPPFRQGSVSTSSRRSRGRDSAPDSTASSYEHQTRRRRRHTSRERDNYGGRRSTSHSTTRSRGHSGHTMTTTTTIFTTPQDTGVMVNEGGGGIGIGSGSMVDPFLSAMLMQTLMASPQYGGGGAGFGVDGMSYEQLLHHFGDGSENMGASETQITSLPESTVGNAETLPADSRQCSICLEDFKDGETRKILPCLHGFHGDCVDKWLRQIGACPICKFRINDSVGGGDDDEHDNDSNSET